MRVASAKFWTLIIIIELLPVIEGVVCTQLLQGSHGLKPKEPVIDFISKFHTHFTGGVFWVNGTCPELIQGAAESIREVSDCVM